MPGWIASRLPALQERFRLPLRAPSPEQLAVGLVVVTIVPAVVLALGSRKEASRPWVYASLFVVAVFFWNAFVPHVTSALVLWEYTPGVLTAAFVNLPYAAITFRRAVAERTVTRGEAIAVGAVAAVLYPVGMLLLWNPGAR